LDMSQYHDLFLTETREHLKKLSELTLALETDHGDKARPSMPSSEPSIQ